MAENVGLANGGDYKKDKKDEKKGAANIFAQNVQADFYQRLNEPFAKWLAAVDPNSDDLDEQRSKWVKQVRDIARRLAEDTVKASAPSAIFGRIVSKDDKSVIYSSVRAQNRFNRDINKLVYEQIGKEGA